MKPMPLPPPQSSAYSMPPPNGNHTPANTNQMLDYLEGQMRGLDMNSPLLQVRKQRCSQISNQNFFSHCHSQLFVCNPFFLI